VNVARSAAIIEGDATEISSEERRIESDTDSDSSPWQR
jgi:hypothetical protein